MKGSGLGSGFGEGSGFAAGFASEYDDRKVAMHTYKYKKIHG